MVIIYSMVEFVGEFKFVVLLVSFAVSTVLLKIFASISAFFKSPINWLITMIDSSIYMVFLIVLADELNLYVVWFLKFLKLFWSHFV